MISKLVMAYLLFTSCALTAQPHIEGEVTVNLGNGLFECNLRISKLPSLKNFKILLNHGMTIKDFRDANDSIMGYGGFSGGSIRGMSMEYDFIDQKRDSSALPETFKIRYTGAFPKYTDSYNTFDFMGWLAITERTIRATQYTDWYPIIYDVDNDRRIDAYTYDIRVSSPDCKTLFLNGSPPVRSSEAQFSSQKAVPLFLFCGNYDFLEVGGDYILNAGIDQNKGQKILLNIEKIKKIYTKILGHEFTDGIYILNHESVQNMDKNSNWGFNVYPTFAFAGLDFKGLVNDRGSFSDNNIRFFGHELGHNYFGPKVISGKLSWFWLESIPEYMSFNVVEELSGDGYVADRILDFVKNLKGREFIPLSKIGESNEIDEIYRYQLGPLLWKIFEDEFGKKSTFSTLRFLYEKSTGAALTLDVWEEGALKSGINKKGFVNFKSNYLDSDSFLEHVLDYFAVNYQMK